MRPEPLSIKPRQLINAACKLAANRRWESGRKYRRSVSRVPGRWAPVSLLYFAAVLLRSRPRQAASHGPPWATASTRTTTGNPTQCRQICSRWPLGSAFDEHAVRGAGPAGDGSNRVKGQFELGRQTSCLGSWSCSDSSPSKVSLRDHRRMGRGCESRNLRISPTLGDTGEVRPRGNKQSDADRAIKGGRAAALW